MIRKGTIASVALTVILSAGLVLANPSTGTKGMDVTQQIHREIVTLPFSGVYFMALSSRLAKTCRIRVLSTLASHGAGRSVVTLILFSSATYS